MISDNIVYLVIADKSYPRKLAFSYVDELSKEFWTSYGPKVESTRKPYAFVGFGKFILLPLNVVFTPNSRPQIRLCQRQLDCIKTLVTLRVDLISTN